MFWDITTSILELFIGAGVFLLAIVMLSKIFGRPSEKLHRFFEKTGKNRFVNAGLGVAAVGITQSSTPTTVIIISLVSAGMLPISVNLRIENVLNCNLWEGKQSSLSSY